MWQPHDLVCGWEETDLLLMLEPTPAWVFELPKPLWGVIRRDLPNGAYRPIGVRGSTKAQRWRGWVRLSQSQKRVTPIEVSQRFLKEKADFLKPPFSQIAPLATLLESFALPWGLTGSLGFQIATGYPVTHAQSDVDLILYPQMVDMERLIELKQELVPFENADIQVQTPYGAFSLKEWTSQQIPVLFKTDRGPRWVSFSQCQEEDSP